MTSALGMGKECSSAILLNQTKPAYTPNKLVNVTGTCGSGTVAYQTLISQEILTAKGNTGELCITAPGKNLDRFCKVEVTSTGDTIGTWIP
jgi:hypothetical protein